MKNFGAKWLALALVTAVGAVASVSLNGCSDGGGGGTAGTTGAAGRGGTTGQAGRGGTGGSTAGTGGTARGGTTGQAGTGGRGGTTGTGGTGGGTAGTTGTGGGTAGTTGTGGAGLPCPGIGTFDTDVQSFALNGFMDSAAGATVNLAVRDGGAKATLAWNGTQGNPTPGSLRVDAPFDAYKQMVDVQRVYGSTMLQNWTGYKLHVRVMVTGGNPSPMNPMGVQPYVNTGATFGGYCGKYTNLVAGPGFNDYVLDLSMCGTGGDPSMVIAFGVSIQTGDGSTGDGGVNSMPPMMATIYVDSFWLEGSCGGTGGTGGGTAGSGGRGGTGGATGGTTGTGGATGGTTGTGGATGGTTGTGGATGGTTGTGGATGGTGGTGGVAALTVSNFDTTLDSFGLNSFMSSSAGAGINLAVREAGAMATAAWDGTQGTGTPVGSARVNAPFDAYNQFIDLVRNFGGTLQDWTGKTSLKVRFKIMSGGNPDPSFPTGAQAYVQTTTGYVGVFGYNSVAAGNDWQVASVALNPATPPTNWNLAQVQQVGIKIVSGSGMGADAAVASGPPTAATIFIDSVWAE